MKTFVHAPTNVIVSICRGDSQWRIQRALGGGGGNPTQSLFCPSSQFVRTIQVVHDIKL